MAAGRRIAVYRIAILTRSEAQGELLMEQISRFCDERGLFPDLEQYRDQEWFFEAARKMPLTNAVIALPGVDGLNAVEHLRASSGAATWIFRSTLFACVWITFCWSR